MSEKQIGPVIDGQICLETGGGVTEVTNPATGQIVTEARCCNDGDVASAVASSAKAFGSPDWQEMTPADRGRLLLDIADRIEQEVDDLAELELVDTGKPIGQLRNGEIPLTAAILRFYAGAADKIDGSVKNTSGGFISHCSSRTASLPEFELAMTLLARVISCPRRDVAVVAVGVKGCGHEFGPPRVRDEPRADIPFYKAKEHCVVHTVPDWRLGQAVELIPSHACTTCNLHPCLPRCREPSVRRCLAD